MNYRLVIYGYGPRTEINKLRFILDKEPIPFKVHRRLVFGIFHHAIDELNYRDSRFTFRSPKHTIYSLLRKMALLALQCRMLLDGIYNGFAITIDINDIKSTDHLEISSSGNAWVSRRIARIGIIIPDLETTLEYALRRKELCTAAVLLCGNLYPRNSNKLSNFANRLFFERSIDVLGRKSDFLSSRSFCDLLPKWHHARSFFSLLANEDKFGARNLYQVAILQRPDGKFNYLPEEINQKISWSQRENHTETIFSKFQSLSPMMIVAGKVLTLDRYLLPYDFIPKEDTLPAALWPRYSWGIPSSNLIATSAVVDECTEYGTALFISNINNWAHFIEDVLPRVILGQSDGNIEALLIGGKIQGLHLETISRFTDLPIIQLAASSRICVKHCLVIVEENRRPIAQSGEIDNLSLIDVELMRKFKETLQPSEISPQYVPGRLYIQRSNHQFRKLLNKKKIEKYLIDNNFRIIRTENLGLQERIDIFASASVVIAESGAGLVNCYFCRPGTLVIEIRHPAMFNNLEYLASVEISKLNYRFAMGSNPSNFMKILHGRDAYMLKNLRSIADIVKS
jgi:hypothetical protein